MPLLKVMPWMEAAPLLELSVVPLLKATPFAEGHAMVGGIGDAIF